MKYLLALFFLTITFSADAQKSYDLKLYSVFGYWNEVGRSNYYLRDRGSFSWLGLSPAITFKQAGRAVDVELAFRYWKVKESSPQNNIEETDYSLRGELGAYIKSPVPKLRLRMAGSIRFYYHEATQSHEEIFGFPTFLQTGGMQLSVVPHLELPITDRLFIDLNTSIFNIHYGVDFHRTYNPALTVRQQQQGGFTFNAWDEFILRIGIAWRITGKPAK